MASWYHCFGLFYFFLYYWHFNEYIIRLPAPSCCQCVNMGGYVSKIIYGIYFLLLHLFIFFCLFHLLRFIGTFLSDILFIISYLNRWVCVCVSEGRGKSRDPLLCHSPNNQCKKAKREPRNQLTFSLVSFNHRVTKLKNWLTRIREAAAIQNGAQIDD